MIIAYDLRVMIFFHCRAHPMLAQSEKVQGPRKRSRFPSSANDASLIIHRQQFIYFFQKRHFVFSVRYIKVKYTVNILTVFGGGIGGGGPYV